MKPPIYQQRSDNRRLFDLLSDYTVDLGFGLTYTVKAPLTSDLASTPFWSWWFIGPPSDFSGPAIPHDDWCGKCKTYEDRAQADAMFLRLLYLWGTPLWKRYIMFVALRLYALVGLWKNDVGAYRADRINQTAKNWRKRK